MIRVFDNLDELSTAAASYIVAMAEQCFSRQGRFAWLLSGGSTPARTFRLLTKPPHAQCPFWRSTHVYWGDERCVSPDSDQSNYHLAKRNLLDHLPIPVSQIHRIAGERADREQAAKEYAAVLPDTPDLVLLGMGPDGHTASLFPGSPALDETRRVAVVQAPKYAQPPERLTITPPVLGTARDILVLAAGGDKAAALARVFSSEGDAAQTPARLARDGTWFVDRPAAAELYRLGLAKIA